MNTSSDTTTNGIRVIVEPEFIPKDISRVPAGYVFSYRVTITNISDIRCKLNSRKWIIINAEGDSEVVEGPGVVGYFPELNPGQSFVYTSYCPLDTSWGTMEGFFYFQDDNKREFFAEIGRFYLVSNEVINI